MRFRPCIDLHDGAVKQIVGATLNAEPGSLHTNFTADLPSSHYADLYRRDGLDGGHVLMLGPGNEAAALRAVRAYPGGLQVGGGEGRVIRAIGGRQEEQNHRRILQNHLRTLQKIDFL